MGPPVECWKTVMLSDRKHPGIVGTGQMQRSFVVSTNSAGTPQDDRFPTQSARTPQDDNHRTISTGGHAPYI